MGRGGGLVDILDRILDKGLCIAGDIRVSLADVELLTIRIRLIICSVDKAEKIGMDWWRSDPYFSPSRDPSLRNAEEARQLTTKIADIDAKLEALMKNMPRVEEKKKADGQQ